MVVATEEKLSAETIAEMKANGELTPELVANWLPEECHAFLARAAETNNPRALAIRAVMYGAQWEKELTVSGIIAPINEGSRFIKPDQTWTEFGYEVLHVIHEAATPTSTQ